MRRFFVKNLLFTVGVNMLVMPAWVFFIDRTVQNRVGAKEYGSYASFYGLALIFAIILDFGITNYNTRTISQNPDSINDVFPTMLTARVVLMAIYGIILGVVGLIAGYSMWEMLLLCGIIVIQCLLTLVQFLRSNVAALHQFKTDSVLSVCGRLLMIVVCGFLLVYPPTAHHFKIEWFVMAQVACYFITAIVSFLVLNRIHPIRLRFSFHGPTLLRIIKQSFPYALLIFLMSVYTRSDTPMIKQLCGAAGKEQAGIYAAAYRWLDVGNMFGLMFAAILLPLFGRMLAQKEDVQPIIKLCVNILLPVSLMIAVAAAFFGNPIMHLLYAAATEYYGHVFSWVMASFPAFCMMYVYSTLLTANGSLKQLNIIALVGVIINLSLNYYLIPRHQALGAAMAAFATQVCVVAGYMLFCGKAVRLPVNIRWVLAHAGYLGLIVLIGYGATLLPAVWQVQLGVLIAGCLLLMFLLRFVSVGAIKQLAEKRG